MITPEKFRTHSLELHPQGAAIQRILAAAINAVAPDEAVRRFVSRQADVLTIAQPFGDISAGRSYDLGSLDRILIFGLGKAASAMTGALVSLLSDRAPRGLVVVKHPVDHLPDGFEQVLGGHPIPNKGSLLAAQKLKELLADLRSTDLLFCLISGGGSALISLPQPGVSLENMQELTSILLACGARIDEVNTLRRHLDAFKGGGLARMAAPAQIVSLILSDVVGSPLEAIASGPTVPDPSSFQDAVGILEKYKLTGKTPPAILHALRTGIETPKPGNKLFDSVQNVVIGDNLLAAQAALQQAELEGLHPFYLGGDLQGEAHVAALELCQSLRGALLTGRPVARPFCLVAGGETTVTLHGNGRGGRNQELALAAVEELALLPGSLLVSLASDGEDGPTDAAGAVVSPETLQRGHASGLSAREYLANNNAYAYFSALDDLLKPGPTGTNVNDLTFLFGF